MVVEEHHELTCFQMVSEVRLSGSDHIYLGNGLGARLEQSD